MKAQPNEVRDSPGCLGVITALVLAAMLLIFTSCASSSKLNTHGYNQKVGR